MNTDLVSLIVANHNGALYLRDALMSALSQSHAEIEVLLADDGSADASLEIAHEIAAADQRLTVLESDRQGGPGAARNRALAVARGEWIAILDSDDLMHPRRIERLLAAAKSGALDVVADDLIYFGAEIGKTLLGPLGLTRPHPLTAKMLLAEEHGGKAGVQLGYLKPMIRRTLLDGMRYREDLPIGEDFDLLLRLLLGSAPAAIIPQSYYLYRRHKASTSFRLNPEHARAMIRAQDDLVIHRADADTLRHALARRRAAIEDTARFEAAVRDLKSGRWARAATGIVSDPRLLARLVKVGLNRSRGDGATAPPAVRRVVIGTAGDLEASTVDGTRVIVPEAGDQRTAAHWADFVAKVARPGLRITSLDAAGAEAAGYLPGWSEIDLRNAEPSRTRPEPAWPWPVFDAGDPASKDRVHVRTTTYRRPDALRRCLESLRAQTHENWVCDVYDDDPEGSGRAVINVLGDPRIHHHQNRPQLFASANIDQCFSRNNPRSATYFCVVEDDNFLLPQYLEENIRISLEQNVAIVFRNQVVERMAGTPDAYVSDGGILDDKLQERIYSPDHFRLSLLAWIGVSNGGLFWSRDAVSDLEIHEPCSATLQEYLRTFAISDPIYVAMTPLAVWAENGEDTKRDLGQTATWLSRELSIKSSVSRLQRLAWARAPQSDQDAFLEDKSFKYKAQDRARGLVKSHLRLAVKGHLPLREVCRLALRGAAIRALGRPEPGVTAFLAARTASG